MTPLDWQGAAKASFRLAGRGKSILLLKFRCEGWGERRGGQRVAHDWGAPYLTESLYNVAVKKSVPAQIRQFVRYISNNEGWVGEFVLQNEIINTFCQTIPVAVGRSDRGADIRVRAHRDCWAFSPCTQDLTPQNLNPQPCTANRQPRLVNCTP